ncbi:TIGR03620 family F420-dependent LLM class oxidoreductase [Nonomuraea sp. NPDC049480]|uniref:TIGR03620 family F420-dependent LLM class oxidoreductase n=1 Tax=Nonomuraea sp. NPDC049480 TaxID=3364353 RepID=UPI00379057D7
MKLELGPVGVTTAFGDWESVVSAAPELEGIGYSTIWLGGDLLRDLDRPAEILRVTRSIPVATCVLPVVRYSADDVAGLYTRLEAAHPGRFVAGMGGAHGPRPLTTLREYFDRMEAIPVGRRMLAAMGPRMLKLAGERTAGAMPMFATPAYTAQARARLGPSRTLVVHQCVCLESDPARARGVARGLVEEMRVVAGYPAQFRRLGFTDQEVDELADRLVDGLVYWGAPDSVAARMREHLAAGADQVSVTALSGDGSLPLSQWRQLAQVLLTP